MPLQPNPDRWQQIDGVLQSALQQPAEDRELFLQRVCQGDAGLEGEVRSLLSAYGRAGNFLEETPSATATKAFVPRDAAEAPDSLVGTTLSHYRITEQLGRGGMGIVYKAEDIRLRRIVAVKFKFLPDRLARDRNALVFSGKHELLRL
jgi:hypothetical protein